MKILIVHNNYGKYSGEEAVVDKMASMLSQHGHEVAFFRMSSEGVRDSLTGKIKGFLSGIYSPAGVKGMREALLREKPDIPGSIVRVQENECPSRDDRPQFQAHLSDRAFHEERYAMRDMSADGQ